MELQRRGEVPGEPAVDHELRRFLLLGIEGRFQRNDYEGINREDDLWNFNAEAKYLVNRFAFLSAGYALRHRDSNVASADFTENAGFLRFGAQY